VRKAGAVSDSLCLARGRSGSDAGAWAEACQVEERAHSKLSRKAF
jgi:hypothetical protein